MISLTHMKFRKAMIARGEKILFRAFWYPLSNYGQSSRYGRVRGVSPEAVGSKRMDIDNVRTFEPLVIRCSLL